MRFLQVNAAQQIYETIVLLHNSMPSDVAMKRGSAQIALERLLSGQVAQADQLHSLIVHARSDSEVTLHSRQSDPC